MENGLKGQQGHDGGSDTFSRAKMCRLIFAQCQKNTYIQRVHRCELYLKNVEIRAFIFSSP